MTHDVVILILILVVLVFGFYKWYRKRDDRLLYALIFLGTLELPRRLLGWPIEISFAMWAFLGFFVLTYKVLYKKLDKSLIAFALVFLVFAIVFLTSVF